MAKCGLLSLLVCLTILVLIAVFALIIVLSTNSDSSLFADGTVEGVGSSTCSGGSSSSIPLDTNSFFDTDFYTTGAPIPNYPGDVDSRTEITVDQLIMGAGAGGLAVADHLSDAFKKAGMPVSMVVIEANKRIGGNVLQVPLKAPPNYDGSFGNLTAAGFAARTTSMSLPRKRKTLTYHRIPIFMTPFMNNIILRGRNVTCQVPEEKAAQAIADNGGEPGTTQGEISDFAFVYGDICTYDPAFIHATDGAYRNLQPDSDPLGNSDPSYNFYLYLLQGAKYGQAEFFPDLATGNYDFPTDPVPHPITGELCTLGTNCPIDLAKGYDIKTFVSKIMSRSTNPNLALRPGNPEYAEFRIGDNVGFLGDDEGAYSALSYIGYQVREWGTTNAVAGYALGGEITLLNKWASRFRSAGGKIFTGERVVSIDSVNSGSIKFVVRTTKRKINVRDFVFTTGSTAYLHNSSAIDRSQVWPGVLMSGNVIDRLRKVPELRAPHPSKVMKVIAQWKPGVPAWFWRFFNATHGGHSYRSFGDFGCFSRMEMIDTPLARCSNYIVLSYTDMRCQKIWQSYFEEAKRTGNNTYAMRRTREELQALIPDVTIPPIELLAQTKTDFGWHWLGREYSFNNSQVFAKAARPLPGTNIAHVSEATNPDIQGWIEGPLAAAEYVLLQHFGSRPGVGTKLRAYYDMINNIALNGDGSVNDGSFLSRSAYQPPLYTTPTPSLMSVNEYWWPYRYNSTFKAATYDYCKASKHGYSFTF